MAEPGWGEKGQGFGNERCFPMVERLTLGRGEETQIACIIIALEPHFTFPPFVVSGKINQSKEEHQAGICN